MIDLLFLRALENIWNFQVNLISNSIEDLDSAIPRNRGLCYMNVLFLFVLKALSKLG